MMYLSEAIKINTSIKGLSLDINNLGTNENNIKYLEEAIKIYN